MVETEQTLETLLAATDYLDDQQRIQCAYALATDAHDGQKRRSGEAYISHPLAVAHILADMQLDADTLCAALLHDVIEDSTVSFADVNKQFGRDVAEIVDGVTKLTLLSFDTPQHEQAENFVKMILAMSKDVRVILIKLADRLHNMRTLGAVPDEKKRLKARETMDIYAPIAMRLGLSRLQRELEDLSFQHLFPDRYRVLSESIKELRGRRKGFISDTEQELHHCLLEGGIDNDVFGREKNIYSLYKKMRRKKLRFDDVKDIYAFRVIVDSIPICYQALGCIHGLYQPVPYQVEDYIAMPKLNGYQSLHTIVVAKAGVHIEVQIRSREMDSIAENGIAAHWRYKQSSEHNTAAKDWINQIMEIQRHAASSIDFLESMKINLLPDEVYVLTPKGDIYSLPADATGIDLAYAIHTDVGNRAVSIRVDGQLMPINTPLHSGETVEVITSEGATPHANWLHQAMTSRARTAIRTYLKKRNNDDVERIGRHIIAQALDSYDKKRIDDIRDIQWSHACYELGFADTNALFYAVGTGKVLTPRVIDALYRHKRRSMLPKWAFWRRSETPSMIIEGGEGASVTLSRCCYPIPGDAIVGHITGRGITVHMTACKNIRRSFDKNREQWMQLNWHEHADKRLYPVAVRIEMGGGSDSFTSVARVLSERDVEIDQLRTEQRTTSTVVLRCVIMVHGRQQLAQLMKEIWRLPSVKYAKRR